MGGFGLRWKCEGVGFWLISLLNGGVLVNFSALIGAWRGRGADATNHARDRLRLMQNAHLYFGFGFFFFPSALSRNKYIFMWVIKTDFNPRILKKKLIKTFRTCLVGNDGGYTFTEKTLMVETFYICSRNEFYQRRSVLHFLLLK